MQLLCHGTGQQHIMDGSTSVYHRAKALGPIFPWLLFGLSSAAAIDAGGISHPSPLFLRGGIATPDRAKQQQQHRWSSSHKRRRRRTQDEAAAASSTVQNYCGKSWTEANESCLRPCPECTSDWDSSCDVCNDDEYCFADLTSCPSLTTTAPDGGQHGQEDGSGGLMIDMGGGVTIWDSNGMPDDVLGGWGATGMLTTPPVPPPIATNTNPPDSSVDTDIVPPSLSSVSVTLPFQQGVSIPSTCPSTTTNIVNVGYYQSWAKYRNPTCHPLHPKDIPVTTFGYTHLIYSFADIHPNTGEIRPYNGVTDEEETLYAEFNSLKMSSSSSLRTSIAVGGWNMDQSLFVHVSSTNESRALFAKSVVTFLVQYNFDGIDFDWEYPAMSDRHGTPNDYTNYPLLVQAVREALDNETLLSGKEYLITMAIPISPNKLDTGYDFITLSKVVDWFHIMAYDVHGSWEENSGSNTDMSYITNTIEAHILNKGVTGDQLVFGMASYGRSMKLTDPTSCMTIGCPISGPGMAGCSGEEGFSPYFELMENYVNTGNYQSLLLNEHTSSMEMILDGGIFVSFDLEDTFQLKRDYYISK
jgi:chitinase